MDEFEGYVDRITFRNEENGYTVIYLVNPKAEDTEDEEECCVGCFSYVAEGSYLLVKGKRTIHKNYGPQLLVESYEEKQPDDTVALERYLVRLKASVPHWQQELLRSLEKIPFLSWRWNRKDLQRLKGSARKWRSALQISLMKNSRCVRQ